MHQRLPFLMQLFVLTLPFGGGFSLDSLFPHLGSIFWGIVMLQVIFIPELVQFFALFQFIQLPTGLFHDEIFLD
jgi:hypothetical protein